MLKVKASQASGKDDEKTKGKKKGEDDSKADVPEMPLFIADFMGQLLMKEKHCDVEFTVGTENDMKKFKAHRLVLAAHSPLFDTMLYGASPDGSDASATEGLLQVRINDIKPEGFGSLLKCVYTDRIEVNDDNLEDLTVVGKKYQIEKIQLACATYMEQGITVKNVCQMFESAARLLGDDKFGLAFIRENIEDIFKSDSFLKLTQPRLEVILSDDKLSTDESVLLEALIKWGKAECKRQDKPGNLEGLKTILVNLLPLVRFPTMDLGEIATVVGPSKLVPDEHLLLLYQYLSILENEKEEDGKKDTKDMDPVEKAQMEADEKEKEACIKKLESFYNLKPRAGGFVAKDSKLLDRKFKKDIYKFFCIKQGGRLVLKLLFRGSRDGFNASSFHSKCDGKPKTLTVIKSATHGNIFGGYYEGEWATSGSYNSAPSWLFSLINKYKKPVKLMPTSQSSNVYNNGSYGPTWGGGHDLHINNNMKSNSNYSSPSTYRQMAPGYTSLGVVYDNTLLAGAYNFTVDEIEVFQVVKITKVKKDK